MFGLTLLKYYSIEKHDWVHDYQLLNTNVGIPNSAIALELHDRVVGSGPAQQAMLSEGPDPANPPYQPFEQNL